MAAGAAAATIAGFNPDDPTASFTASMPVVIRDLTLLAIAVGAIAANALNIYSGAMSFLAAGIKIPFALRRAIVALGFGVIGFFIAWSALADAGTKYENFLLVIAYWIAPWLGVVLTDRLLRRGTEIASLVPAHAKYRNPAGVDRARRRRFPVDLAVLQPDLLHRPAREGGAHRRPHTARRVRARRRCSTGCCSGCSSPPSAHR